MLPTNVALIAIATLFYLWRDAYVPRRQRKDIARERIAKLLWAVAAHPDSDSLPESLPEEFLDESDAGGETDAAYLLFREVECRACGGRHSFHLSSESKSSSTYEFTCPTNGSSAWIWWLGKSEPAEEAPADSVALKWTLG